jgi:enamine deaminase RidA (YjgF/YER057c/UK114 family)
MPILDITLVGSCEANVSRIADAAGEVLGTDPSFTWVCIHRVSEYAENRTAEPPSPVIVRVLLRALPDDREPLARALGAAIGKEVGRSHEDVHVIFEPPAAGRIAFGGELVPGPIASRASSGAKWEAIVGYSRAVRIREHVWVTGTTAFGDPPVEAGAYAQSKRTLENIERALIAVGAKPSDVVRTRMFVVDIERDWEAVGRAHAEMFGEVRPATTMVEVRKLIEPWMLVEIEADAFVR